MIEATLTVQVEQAYTLEAQNAEEYSLTPELNIVHRVVTDPYEGDYEITPSDLEQIIPILGKTATQDIRINPVPSDYGRITWNGSTLTVY